MKKDMTNFLALLLLVYKTSRKMDYMTQEVNSTTINIIKKLLNLNKIVMMVCEGKGENFSYIKEEEKMNIWR